MSRNLTKIKARRRIRTALQICVGILTLGAALSLTDVESHGAGIKSAMAMCLMLAGVFALG